MTTDHTTIVVRRGMRGTIVDGTWQPVAIQGGADGDLPLLEQLAVEGDRLFPEEDRTIRRAAETAQRDLARLLRPDGSRIYSDQEHQERTRAILQTFDEVGMLVTEKVNATVSQVERDLVALEAEDAWGRLSEADQAAATVRREFVKEDAARLPVYELERAVRGAIASQNRPLVYLYSRYVGMRRETDKSPALIQLNADLQQAISDPTANERRQKLERRQRAAKFFTGRPEQVKRSFDGSMERMKEQMRSSGRYGI